MKKKINKTLLFERELKLQSNTKKIYDPKCLKIIWLLPDFGKGSGGHTNIFRMIHWLEKFGHKNSMWICGETHHRSTERAKKVICENFFKIDSKMPSKKNIAKNTPKTGLGINFGFPNPSKIQAKSQQKPC